MKILSKKKRKLEKLDYFLLKEELDLQFLFKCDDSNVIPKFLNFRLANSHLKYSSTDRLCVRKKYSENFTEGIQLAQSVVTK